MKQAGLLLGSFRHGVRKRVGVGVVTSMSLNDARCRSFHARPAACAPPLPLGSRTLSSVQLFTTNVAHKASRMQFDSRVECLESISGCPICRINTFIAIGEVQQRPAKSGRLEGFCCVNGICYQGYRYYGLARMIEPLLPPFATSS